MDSVSDEAEYLSTCNVCFIKFDLDEFRPKVLPCSHTFCFRCLQVIHSETTLSCPMCRSSFELEEVASLPNNIYAQHIIHLNQLLEQLIQLSMHWCFSCGRIAKPNCQKKHTVFDWNPEAKELQVKMKLLKDNLNQAVEKRRQLKKNLDECLSILEAQTNDIHALKIENRQELQQLQSLLGMERKFTKNRWALESSYDEVSAALNVSSEMVDECQARLKLLQWMGPSPELSYRCRAFLLRTETSKTNLIRLRRVELPLLGQDGIRRRETIACLSFNPVKPILACGLKSGTLNFFIGDSYYSSFTNWTVRAWKFGHVTFTAMDWNALGNELAIGNIEGRVTVWNVDTDVFRELHHASLNGKAIYEVKWNRKWAPDLLAVSCENLFYAWDISKRKKKPTFRSEPHSSNIKHIAWISANNIAVCTVSGEIIINTIDKRTPHHILKTKEAVAMEGLWWNSNMQMLASCCQNADGIFIWELEECDNSLKVPLMNRMQRRTLETEKMYKEYFVVCVDWYPSTGDYEYTSGNEGVIACGTREHLVVLFNAGSKASFRRCVGHTDTVNYVAFSSDGTYLASLSSGNELIIWSSSKYYKKLALIDATVSGTVVTWSPCCTRLFIHSESIQEKYEEISLIELDLIE